MPLTAYVNFEAPEITVLGKTTEYKLGRHKLTHSETKLPLWTTSRWSFVHLSHGANRSLSLEFYLSHVVSYFAWIFGFRVMLKKYKHPAL